MALRTSWRKGVPYLVRHLDKSLLVVEKAAGLLTHTTDKKTEANLHDHLRQFVRGRGGGDVFGVHRLDRVVSGLLVYARRPNVQSRLIEQFAAHDVERRYVAGVLGDLPEDEGTFESWLVTDAKSLRVFSGKRGAKNTRRAVTHWRVLERFGKATLVEVRLETGLRNQIRVHFAEAGHPVLGERKYAAQPKLQKAHRIMLHAAELGFVHPSTGRGVRFEAPLPPDLVAWKGNLARGDLRQPRR